MDKQTIIKKLQEIKPIYQKEGIEIIGLFGSYAKDNATQESDIDIVYGLDYEQFSKKYHDGFSKILRLDEIKKDLEKMFQKKIDLIPNKNPKLFKEIIYV